MKKLFYLACSVFLISCDHQENKGQETAIDNNASFDRYKERFVEELWKMYPDWATSQGYHAYDSVLVIPGPAERARRLQFVKNNLDSLSHFPKSSLNSNNAIDLALIGNFLKSTEWGITTFKSYEWDPSMYNYGSVIGDILNNKQVHTDAKAATINAKLKNLETYFAAAKADISSPTKEHTDLAISQLKGTVSFLETSVKDSIKALGNELSYTYLQNLDKAVVSTNAFIKYLEGLRKEMEAVGGKIRSFRIGKELYDQKFAFDIQSGMKAEEVYEKALQRKDELHQEMAAIAKRLWPKYMGKAEQPADVKEMIKALIGTIAKTHVKREDFQKEIEREIPILTGFVKKKNLLYMDPSKPLVVRKEPEWMAGVAGASISSPGPYDKNGNTFYNVGSLAAYSPADAESYLREYNKYILQILNIHEAIPGHYAQLIYSNQSPSIIKTILGNGAMVEGWAVYAERMMLEEGWAKNTEINGSIEEDEMWLMYYKWHLRVVCNTILDYSVHVKGMTEDEALNLLMNEAFQEKAEAQGKWRRATLTQVQLCSYYTGFAEIFDFRESLKKKEGKAFDLKKFHEKFLSYGSAPVKYIKELMQ
ncbi:MAG: DUF885 domain-containing protein [Bacteroidetes bacterium]|nr:DUF885 domain-containing protein [Bacteroidota bacterium]